MKIAIDCRMLGKSGIGTFTKNLLENLPAQHTYLLIGDKNKLKQYTAEKNIIDCQLPIFSLQEIFNYPTTAVNNCAAYFTPNWNVPAGIKIPIYSMIHDIVFLEIPEINSGFGRLIRYWLLRRAIKLSAHIFTVSEFSKQRIEYRFKPSQNKISVVYNDVSNKLKKFIIDNQPAKTNDYYLYIGNIKKHKGLSTLIAAYQKLKTADKLYIVGDKENFRTRDNNFNNFTQENIVFTGHISEPKLYEILYNAKALIQPSLYEGFGIPPLEALWLKTPVILSDISVFKEIYSDMPVTFFQAENQADLLQKLQNIQTFNYDTALLKKFDMAKTSKEIFDIIKNQVQSQA